MPSARITVYPITIATSVANASPPPRIAFRHVQCLATPASGTRCVSGRRGDHTLALFAPGHEHDRQSDREQHRRTGQHPIGKPEPLPQHVHHREHGEQCKREKHGHAHRIRAPERCLGAAREHRRRTRRCHPATWRRHRLQQRQHLRRALHAIRRLLLEAAHHERRERRRHARALVAKRRGRVLRARRASAAATSR